VWEATGNLPKKQRRERTKAERLEKELRQGREQIAQLKRDNARLRTMIPATRVRQLGLFYGGAE